jgi:hypothetical protein
MTNFYREVVGDPIHREGENREFTAHGGALTVWCFSQTRGWWHTPFVWPGRSGGVAEVAVTDVQLGNNGGRGKALSLVVKQRRKWRARWTVSEDMAWCGAGLEVRLLNDASDSGAAEQTRCRVLKGVDRWAGPKCKVSLFN